MEIIQNFKVLFHISRNFIINLLFKKFKRKINLKIINYHFVILLGCVLIVN